jgi:hypothetical protein
MPHATPWTSQNRVFHSQRDHFFNSILLLLLLSATSVGKQFLTYEEQEVI